MLLPSISLLFFQALCSYFSVSAASHMDKIQLAKMYACSKEDLPFNLQQPFPLKSTSFIFTYSEKRVEGEGEENLISVKQLNGPIFILCTKLHTDLFALCSVPLGKRSGRKSKCKLSR